MSEEKLKTPTLVPMPEATDNTITNAELFERFRPGLNACGDLPGLKFGYAMGKMLERIERIGKTITKANKPTKAADAFDKAHKELLEQHADRDDKGEIIMTPGRPPRQAFSDRVAFDAAFGMLKLEHAEGWADKEKSVEEMKAWQDEPAEIEFYKIKFCQLPKGIKAGQQAAIREMILPPTDEDEASEEKAEE